MQLDQSMVRAVGQADPVNLWVLAKVSSYSLGIVDVAFNPQGQAFQALQKQEGVERTEAGPNRCSPLEDQPAFRLLVPFPAHES